MTRGVTLFTAFYCFCAAQAAAQVDPQQAGPGAPSVRPATTNPGQLDSRKMYEDIEVMRRLLQKKFDSLHTARVNVMWETAMMGAGGTHRETVNTLAFADGGEYLFLADTARRQQSYVENINGVYLPGHGVVLTINLPEDSSLIPNPHAALNVNLKASACINCHASNKLVQQKFVESLAKQPRPLTDWEKTRRDVLGIKDTNRKKTKDASVIEICDPGTISELVLHVLGENGRNFSQLPIDEQVTVAITFRLPKEKPNRKLGAGLSGDPLDGGAGGGLPYGGGAPVNAGPGVGPPRVSGGFASGFGANDAGADNGKSKYRDYLLLGDLHMKQNKADQALRAYERALSQIANPEKLTSAQLQDASHDVRQAILNLHRKLVEAALADKQVVLAKKWVDRLVTLQKNPSEQETPQHETLPLPARLVISAKKSVLDQFGAKEITYEDFKQKASVKHLPLTNK